MIYPNWFVCVMGMGTVFAGLIILIFAVKIMGLAFGRGKAQEEEAAAEVTRTAPAPSPADPAAVTPEVIAAVSAAIVEDMGLPDITALRIVSIKRV
ncbi:MAG: OadG family protein [Clostridia bacterium]|nr:OadG family protein [Clostridia bacterium]